MKPLDTKQEHPARERPGDGEAPEPHGHTGEGAASALAHLISQDQKRLRKQDAEPAEPSA